MMRDSHLVMLGVAAAPSGYKRFHLHVGLCHHATSRGTGPVDSVADRSVGMDDLERRAGAIGRTSAGASVSEKDVTLAVGLAVAPLLRADGFGVVLSRTTDTTVAQLDSGDQAGGVLTVQGVYHDLKARIDCANTAHANFLVAIHFDAAESSVRGAETIYDTARPFRSDNQRLAQLVQQEVVLSLSA